MIFQGGPDIWQADVCAHVPDEDVEIVEASLDEVAQNVVGLLVGAADEEIFFLRRRPQLSPLSFVTMLSLFQGLVRLQLHIHKYSQLANFLMTSFLYYKSLSSCNFLWISQQSKLKLDDDYNIGLNDLSQ